MNTQIIDKINLFYEYFYNKTTNNKFFIKTPSVIYVDELENVIGNEIDFDELLKNSVIIEK